MNSKKLFATIALSATLLSGCAFMPAKDTIIKVNDKNITMSQFNEVFNKAASNSMFTQMGIDIKKDQNGFLYLMVKDKVVNELIIKSLIDQEMEKRGVKVTKADIEKEFKTIIDKVGSKEKFEEILKQNGISPAQFKKDLAEEVKMKKLVSTLAKVTVTEAEAKKFYQDNLNKFKYPDKVRASHILIAANPEEIKQKLSEDPANKGLTPQELQKKVGEEVNARLEKAKKLLAEVKKDPSTFAKVARENSEDKASAKQGGDLGFFSKQEMVEPFAKAAFAMKPNTIGEIVKSPYGFHIILVTDRMKAGQEPYEKVKNEIYAYLENQQQVKLLENLIESLKKQAKIEYVNPEFDPKNIQKQIKEETKKGPTAVRNVAPKAPQTPAKPEAKK